MTVDDLLRDGSFHLSSGDGGVSGARLSAWGRVAHEGFDADVYGVSPDGHITSTLFDADAQWSEALAGVVLSRSSGAPLDSAGPSGLALRLNADALWVGMESYATTGLISTEGRHTHGLTRPNRVIATAILDRVLHHAVTVNIRGNSYRLKDKLKSGLVRAEEPSDIT